jgi:hypothetical protein
MSSNDESTRSLALNVADENRRPLPLLQHTAFPERAVFTETRLALG